MTEVDPASQERTAERRDTQQRAEELMERFTSDAARVLSRAFGRAREEVEDIVAEARSMNGC
ncbi:MAG TPA: hypothetical protein VG294_01995 [Solirubrobacteraceae bacterium]|jgi:hypothetical protein|nr:hypothetical protein [Solirubrobacteraceae bacterium]